MSYWHLHKTINVMIGSDSRADVATAGWPKTPMIQRAACLSLTKEAQVTKSFFHNNWGVGGGVQKRENSRGTSWAGAGRRRLRSSSRKLAGHWKFYA